MSRRQGSPNDPTPQPALRVEATSLIQAMLDDLGEREAGVITMRWGLKDGYPKTLDEIGRAYGVTRERIRQIESKCMSKLRYSSKSSPLAVTDGKAVVGFVDIRRAAADLAPIYPVTLIWCTHCHERQFDPRSGVPAGGRPRKYCSDKCRQAAYRVRRRLTAEPRPGNATPGI